MTSSKSSLSNILGW